MEELREDEMKGIEGGACSHSIVGWYREEVRTDNKIRYQIGEVVDYIVIKDMIPNYAKNEIRLYRGDRKAYSVGKSVSYGEIRFQFTREGQLRISKIRIQERLRCTAYLYTGVKRDWKKITISI